MFTTRPKPRSTMPGSARRMVWKAAERLMAMIRSQVAAGISLIGAVCCTPAQFTSTSGGDQACSFAIIRSTASGSDRSASK